MTKSAMSLIVFGTAVLSVGPSVSAETVTVPNVTGEGISPEAAKKDALRKALEQGAGVILSSHSQTRNFELVRDTIFSRADGLVKKFDILESGAAGGGIFFCTIRAEVSTDAVATEWGAVQNVLDQIGRPKVMVYIAETIDREPQTSSILESEIEKRLIDRSFEVYDSSHLDAIQAKEAADALRSGDDAKMAALAKRFHTQIFVMGHANADRAEHKSVRGVDLIMYNCDVQAKVYYTDTGKLLASDSLPSVRGGARGYADYSPQAGKMAMSNAAEPLMEQLYQTVMKSWAYQISAGGEIRFEVTGLPSANVAFKLKKNFRAIPNIEDINGPEYDEGMAIFRIIAKMTAEDLMEHLIEGELGEMLEVEDVKLNRIQAKWVGDK